MGKTEVKMMLVVSGASKEGLVVIKKVFEVIKNKLSIETLEDIDLTVTTYDVITHGDLDTEEFCIAFGVNTRDHIQAPIYWKLPSANSLIPGEEANSQTRREALAALSPIAEELDRELVKRIGKKEEPTQTYVEKDKITIGKMGTMIEVTEAEAEYLKRIKALLGGGKMVITKGDLKIEVEG